MTRSSTRPLRGIAILLLMLAFIATCACSGGSQPGLEPGDGDGPDGDSSDGDDPSDGDDGDLEDGDRTDGDDPDGDDPGEWGDCERHRPDADALHASPYWGLPDCRVDDSGDLAFGERHPWLLSEVNSWYECTTYDPPGSEPKDTSEFGSYGVGNGTVFAQVGPWAPRNTLHGLLGTGYHKRGQGFFSDFRSTLRRDGALLPWRADRIWTPRETQIVVTDQHLRGTSDLALQTLTFSPPPSRGGDLGRVIVQVIGVINRAPEGSEENLQVRVQSYSKADGLGDELPFIAQVRDHHRLRVAPLEAENWSVVENGFNSWPALESAPFSLAAGESRVFVMVYEFTREDAPVGEGRLAVAREGWEALLTETRDWWTDWHAQGLRIQTRDWRVDDLIAIQKGLVRLQIADTGALVPMSHYTATWMRDSYAPARTLLKFGYPQDAKRIMDYYFMGASARGRISNSMDADIVYDEAPPQPDWYTKIPFSGRERGEGPSHIPLMHTDYWRYTGQVADFAGRWDYLMHTLMGQGITEEEGADGLMYFSGDETFRPQLSANLGLPGGANYKFEDLAYSANTAFLFVSAAEELAALGEAMGQPADDIQWLHEHAQWIREATERHYWLEEEGRYSPFIYMDTLQPETSPAEDVNTQPLWTRYQERDDPQARRNILSSFEAIGQTNHLLQIVPPESVDFMGYDVGGGLMTGMAPSYFLYNVAHLGLSWADQTFDSVGTYATAGGEAYEVGIFTQPGKPFCPLYFRGGGEGELYARMRPWEGAILGEALAHFLTGYDADLRSGVLVLAPRIPHDLPREEICAAVPHLPDAVHRDLQVRAEGIAFGQQRLTMLYRHTYENGYEFSLETGTEQSFAEIGIRELRVRLHGVARREPVLDEAACEPVGIVETLEWSFLDDDRFELVFVLNNPDTPRVSLHFGVTR